MNSEKHHSNITRGFLFSQFSIHILATDKCKYFFIEMKVYFQWSLSVTKNGYGTPPPAPTCYY